MEHLMLRPPPSFAHHDEYAGMLFDQQLAPGYDHVRNQTYDAYTAAAFEPEAMSNLQLDANQFCFLSPEQLDGQYYSTAAGMHGAHRESLQGTTFGMEHRVVFPSESWSSLYPQDRMGSPVDTVSSCKSSHPHSPLPRTMSNATLAMQQYPSNNFQHLDGPSVFFQEAEPVAILPSQSLEAELDTCRISKLDGESGFMAPQALKMESDDADAEQEASSDESELTWRQREKSEADSDYTPRPSATRRRNQAGRAKGSSAPSSRSKVAKKSSMRHGHMHSPQRAAFAAEAQRSGRVDGECERRSFTCLGRPYGCQTTFTSKNEWKRHVISQHLCLGYWRCDLCSADREKCPNDFNRKDLFTQHLRRMHAPPSTTGAIVPAPSKSAARRAKGRPKPTPEDEEFAQEIERIRERCWVQARQPPSHLECTFCQQVFEGDGACLEEFLEHVGRHLAIAPGDSRTHRDNEQQHGANSVRFQKNETLRQWMVDNGLLRRKNGRWELCNPGTASTPPFVGSADAEGDPE